MNHHNSPLCYLLHLFVCCSVLPVTMDRAIKNIVSSIVQRSVLIAAQTKELVLKVSFHDFLASFLIFLCCELNCQQTILIKNCQQKNFFHETCWCGNGIEIFETNKIEPTRKFVENNFIIMN